MEVFSNIIFIGDFWCNIIKTYGEPGEGGGGEKMDILDPLELKHNVLHVWQYEHKIENKNKEFIFQHSWFITLFC